VPCASRESRRAGEEKPRVSELKRGFVLLTGAAGQRKSTTLAALIEVINRARPAHIITYEDVLGAALDPRELARLMGRS
jgi:twitching motility protein PilT